MIKGVATIGIGTEFTHEEFQVNNAKVLYSPLNRIQDEQSTMTMYGVLNTKSRKTTERTKEKIRYTNPAWICLGVDKFELPNSYDVVNATETCIHHFVKTALPPEFSNA